MALFDRFVGDFIADAIVQHHLVLDTDVKKIDAGYTFEDLVRPDPIHEQRSNNLRYCIRELHRIKQLPITEIPCAINELFSVHAYRSDLLIQDEVFVCEAMARVFSCIGHGSYSNAYALDEEQRWILKMNCANAYGVTDGSFDWLMACTNIQGNVFAPKIVALHQTGYLYAAVVERLSENAEEFGAPDGGCFIDLAEQSFDPEFDWDQYLGDMESYPEFIALADINRDDLIQLSEVYREVSELTRAEDDLEYFNLMLRGDQPVINDPFGLSESGALAPGNSFSWVADYV